MINEGQEKKREILELAGKSVTTHSKIRLDHDSVNARTKINRKFGGTESGEVGEWSIFETFKHRVLSMRRTG